METAWEFLDPESTQRLPFPNSALRLPVSWDTIKVRGVRRGHLHLQWPLNKKELTLRELCQLSKQNEEEGKGEQKKREQKKSAASKN